MKKDDKTIGQPNLFAQGMDSNDAWAGILKNMPLDNGMLSGNIICGDTIVQKGQPLTAEEKQLNLNGMSTFAYTEAPTIEERISGMEATLIEVVSLLKLIGSVVLDRVPEIRAKKGN